MEELFARIEYQIDNTLHELEQSKLRANSDAITARAVCLDVVEKTLDTLFDPEYNVNIPDELRIEEYKQIGMLSGKQLLEYIKVLKGEGDHTSVLRLCFPLEEQGIDESIVAVAISPTRYKCATLERFTELDRELIDKYRQDGLKGLQYYERTEGRIPYFVREDLIFRDQISQEIFALEDWPTYWDCQTEIMCLRNKQQYNMMSQSAAGLPEEPLFARQMPQQCRRLHITYPELVSDLESENEVNAWKSLLERDARLFLLQGGKTVKQPRSIRPLSLQPA